MNHSLCKKEKILFTNAQLADLLNVKINYLRVLKNHNKERLKDNKHFISVPGFKKGSPPMIKWTKQGALFLANKIRTPEAGIFLQKMGIKERHRSRVEYEAIGIITHAIKGFAKFKKQYSVYQFKIDLYLPEQKIAIECDESSHKGYNQSNEKFRETVIKEKLNCEFIRFSPSPPSNIGDIINKIFRIIDFQKLKP